MVQSLDLEAPVEHVRVREEVRPCLWRVFLERRLQLEEHVLELVLLLRGYARLTHSRDASGHLRGEERKKKI